MRKLLLVSIALITLLSGSGCQCCRDLLEAERRKNDCLRNFFCCGCLGGLCGQGCRSAAPVAAPICPPVAAAPIYAAPPPQSYTVAPTVIAAPPTVACPQPVNICPPIAVCQPVQQCCPQQCPQQQTVVCPETYDPCETMYCP